jgi:hypothetical protein
VCRRQGLTESEFCLAFIVIVELDLLVLQRLVCSSALVNFLTIR